MTTRSALVTLSDVGSDVQSIPNDTPTPVSFADIVRNDGGWFNPLDPTKLTVPAGVSKVKVSSCTVFDGASTSGVRQITIKKNGNFVKGGGVHNTLANARTTTDLGTYTTILDVVPGDYFTTEVFHNAGVALDIFNFTWFAIEEVE